MAMACLGQGITDIDNNFYDTIRIGTQTWFARNLKAIRLNDGTPIPNVTAQANWAAQTSPAFCWYNNETANRDIYGALYNGFAVKTGKLCPTGWHVPTDDDWSDLVLFLGGPTVAAGKLKATGTANWQSPNVGATNEFGFSALPGGYRPSDNFYTVGVFGFWWSSTEYETGRAWTQAMRHDEPGMMAPTGLDFGNGLSVRCIKDLSADVITDLADAESDKPMVYPNPVRDFLYVEFDRAQSRTLTIYDAVGAELVNLEVAGKSQAIDVRHLPRGLFVLKIQTQAKADFVRFINSGN